MSDRPDIPEAESRTPRRSLAERLSIVWLIPLAALLIALGIAWQNYIDRGPLIEISFGSASGVTANETEVRFRDVTVGIVEEVSFADDLQSVNVGVRLEKSIAEYVDDDARFWIVQPEVTAQGITGLDTVISGVFIEGVWNSEPNGLVYEHEGLTSAPLAQAGQRGTEFVLRSDTGTGLNDGTPIVYKGINVGRLGRARLTENGEAAETDAIIFAPYDSFVSETTRFWDISGVSFSLGPQGAELEFGSLASLVTGGITFETIVSGGDAISAGDVFTLFPDEDAARSSVFSTGRGPELQVTAIFGDNVAGLSSGAPVQLGGVQIGEVTNLSGIVDVDRFGDQRVRLLTTLAIQPSQLGLQGTSGPAEALDYLTERVAEGLRARLASASILTGGLKVELIDVPDAAPAEIDVAAEPYPELPTAEGELDDVTASAEGLLEKLQGLPIEDLLRQATLFLENASALVGSEEIRAVPVEVTGLLRDVRGVVGSEEVQAIPGEVDALIADLRATIADLASIASQVEEAGAVDRLLTAIDRAGDAAEAARTTLEAGPALLAEIEGLAQDARGLPLDDLVTEATAVAAAVRAVAEAESTQAIPASVDAALTDIERAADGVARLVAELDEAGVAERLVAAIDSAATAAAQAEQALSGAPALIAEVQGLAADARALPLEDLVRQATALAEGGAAFIASPDAQALPASLTAALSDVGTVANDVSTLVGSLNEAGAAERLAAAVDAAASAASQAEQALAGAPALIQEVQGLAADARALPLEDLVQQAAALAESGQALIGSPSAQALPADLSAALADVGAVANDVSTLVTDLNERGAADRLVAAIDATTEAVAAIETTATGVTDSVAGVPALIERLQAVADDADRIEIDRLANEASTTLAALRALLQAEGAEDVAANLSGALAEIEAAVAELRAGGTVENVNDTLASADRAAEAIADAADQLPGLVERINLLLAQAEGTLASLDGESELNREARAALREVERAAGAVESLSRAIERRPNSIILGR